MEKQEIFYRLALGQVAGIGAKKQKYLLEHFKSAQEIFNSSPKYLKSLPFLNETSALSIKSFADFSAIEKEMNYNDKNGIAAIFFDDDSNIFLIAKTFSAISSCFLSVCGAVNPSKSNMFAIFSAYFS
jgi:DNA processing protein